MESAAQEEGDLGAEEGIWEQGWEQGHPVPLLVVLIHAPAAVPKERGDSLQRDTDVGRGE